MWVSHLEEVQTSCTLLMLTTVTAGHREAILAWVELAFSRDFLEYKCSDTDLKPEFPRALVCTTKCESRLRQKLERKILLE